MVQGDFKRQHRLWNKARLEDDERSENDIWYETWKLEGKPREYCFKQREQILQSWNGFVGFNEKRGNKGDTNAVENREA